MHSTIDIGFPLAKDVKITNEAITVELKDGRVVSVPLAWFPRLVNGSRHERNKWRLIGEGDGIHWPDLDEDISVEGLLAGRMSCESDRSLQRWLDSRAAKPGKKKKSA